MAIHENGYIISGDLINEIIASNTIRDQDVQDRVIVKLQNVVRAQDEAPTAEATAMPEEELTEGEGIDLSASGFIR